MLLTWKHFFLFVSRRSGNLPPVLSVFFLGSSCGTRTRFSGVTGSRRSLTKWEEIVCVGLVLGCSLFAFVYISHAMGQRTSQ